MSKLEFDKFRASILYVKDGNTFNAAVSVKTCCSTREVGGQCQWPRIAPAIVRLATANDAGRETITKAGCIGEMNDWEAYALWLGQKHSQRLWRELVSNSVIVITGFFIHCERQRTLEPCEYESDVVGAAMDEIWSSGKVAPVHVAGVREAHATDRDDGLAESGTHDAESPMGSSPRVI
ncbi:hypothetical protein E4U40_003396 [Claviceps sp. LM458 group G5]|nr:hypothetical protein E4U40_003396 [Claviceps sp. LM458 group G5]